MEIISLEGTEDTPKILLDKGNGIMVVKWERIHNLVQTMPCTRASSRHKKVNTLHMCWTLLKCDLQYGASICTCIPACYNLKLYIYTCATGKFNILSLQTNKSMRNFCTFWCAI